MSGISIDAARRLITRAQAAGQPPTYVAPTLRPHLPALKRSGWWELRDDGTAYDWVVGSDGQGPWSGLSSNP